MAPVWTGVPRSWILGIDVGARSLVRFRPQLSRRTPSVRRRSSICTAAELKVGVD